MAPSKLAIPSIFLALIFSQIRAQAPGLGSGSAVLPDSFTSDGAPSPDKFINSVAGVSNIGEKTTEHEKNTPSKNGVSPGKAYLHGNSGM
ncbi:unnamed protein product [Malus baccata var. baccata]